MRIEVFPQNSDRLSMRVSGYLAGLFLLLSSCTTKNDLSLIFSNENTPSFTLTVNNSEKYTGNVAVTASIQAAQTLSEMSVTVGLDCIDTWETYSTSKALTLSNAEGEQTISAKVRTVDGFESECVQQKITLDRSGPVISGALSLKATRSLLNVSPILNPPAISDNYSGVDKYEIKLVKTAGNVVLKDWTVKNKDQMYFDGLTLNDSDADSYFYIIRATDKVGNVSSETISPTFIAGPIVTITEDYLGHTWNSQLAMGSFSIELSRATTSDVTASVKAISGSAIAGIDFYYPDVVPEQITIPAGSTYATGYFSIISNATPGPTNSFEKTFELSLTGVENASSVLNKQAQILRNTVRQTLGDLPTVDATGYKALKGARGHMCGVTLTDKIECWGAYSYDNGSPNYRYAPAEISGVTNFSALANGYGYHTCYIDTAGDLYCFGTNLNGELGNNTLTNSTTPVKHPTLTNVKKVTTGIGFTCVIDSTDKVQCWGANDKYQVGLNNTTTQYSTPQLHPNITKAIDIFAGNYIACAIDETAPGVRSVKCWGKNSAASASNLINITGIPNDIQSLSVNGSNSTDTRHACGLTASQRIFCWGSNHLLRRGTTSNTTWNVANEVLLGGGVKPTKIKLGPDASCVLGDDKYLYCWGVGIVSGSATSELLTTATPTKIALLGGSITDFEPTEYVTCVLGMDTKIRCMGQNTYGEAGNGHIGHTFRAIAFNPDQSTAKYTQVAAGIASSCAIKADKTVTCWGGNADGQLGNNNQNTLTKPSYTLPISNVQKIEGRSYSYCALTEAGRVYCWGANDTGQTGNGVNDGADVLIPKEIPVTYPNAAPGLTQAKDIAVGYNHACAVISNGTIQCWGNNFDYQIGESNNGSFSAYAQNPLSLTSVDSVAAGINNTCAVRTNGANKEIYCWGSNAYGILGNGGASTYIPQLVTTIATTKEVKVYIGYEAACYINDGTTKCWGKRTGYKSLPVNVAVGTTVTPTTVAELAGAKSMSLAAFNGCANFSYGMKCWGVDFAGLVNGTDAILNVPTNAYAWQYGKAASLVVGMTLLPGGPHHACGVSSLGDLKCWGISLVGEGNNYYNIPSPTTVKKY